MGEAPIEKPYNRAEYPGTDGRRNLISHSLAVLRQSLSQRELAHRLQLVGLDVDKNVITRIETNKRLVRDIELQVICEVLGTTCDELLNSSVAYGDIP